MNAINNEADSGVRAINIGEIKRCEWLIRSKWLKGPENEWPDQTNVIIAKEEANGTHAEIRKLLFSGDVAVTLAG